MKCSAAAESIERPGRLVVGGTRPRPPRLDKPSVLAVYTRLTCEQLTQLGEVDVRQAQRP